MPKQPVDIGASVRARLLKYAKATNQQYDLVLTRYVLERLLYRLSISAHRERFALKGALLVTTWFDSPLRPTRDLDLLGFGDLGVDDAIEAFGDVCKSQPTMASYSRWMKSKWTRSASRLSTVVSASRRMQRSAAREFVF